MMAGLEDVEAWLDASDKNGVSVANSILISCSSAVLQVPYFLIHDRVSVMPLPCFLISKHASNIAS